jgi:hypothetical protein
MVNAGEYFASFQTILGCLRDGSEYSQLPPRGPPSDLPSLTDDEIDALQTLAKGDTLHSDFGYSTYAYESLKFVEDSYAPRDVAMPSPTDLDEVNIYAIDGSNQRVDRASFHIVMTRAALVQFHYSLRNTKPYTALRKRDCQGMVLADGNVFKDELAIHMDCKAGDTIKKEYPMLRLVKNSTKPILTRFDPESCDKNPKSHALGWAVKLQQALELALLEDVPDGKGVCIRDGPLFSTSVSISDTQEGLEKTISWSDKILVSSSKRVSDSTLLLQALLSYQELRDYWFNNQELTTSTLKTIANDTILIPRILKPGQRTPMIAAIPRARKAVVENEERLTPLACYYLRKCRPHTIIRFEVPLFFWERDPEAVEWAISLAAWQHELGGKAPLIQLYADRSCQLMQERQMMERQVSLSMYMKNLSFPEEYE